MVFGVHSGPGDALVLLFEHLIGILVGLVQHPDFEEQIQKPFLRQEFPGKVGQRLDGLKLPLTLLPDYRLRFLAIPILIPLSDSIPRLL